MTIIIYIVIYIFTLAIRRNMAVIIENDMFLAVAICLFTTYNNDDYSHIATDYRDYE